MITDVAMDATFQALAHQTRRRIMDLVRDHPGLAVGELAKHFDVSRIAIINHLSVLERAGLVISEKAGRSRRLYLNVAPLQMINDRWLNDFSAHWAGRMTAIKYAAEGAAARDDEDQDQD